MKRACFGVLAAAVCLSIPGIAAAGGHGGGTLTVLEVPPVPDGATDVFNDAWKINDDGVIVGSAYYFVPLEGDDFIEVSQALRWVGHEMEILGGNVVTTLDDGTEVSTELLYADARGINRHGDIVGYVYTDRGDDPWDYAAVWDDDDDVWRTVPLPEGAFFAIGRDINDRGHVAGGSSAGPWIWRGGEPELLPRLYPGFGCGVYAMNNLDMVTGFCFDAEGRSHAVVWWLGRVRELKSFGGQTNWGRAINDLGQIVGFANVPDDPSHGQPVTWSILRPDVVRVLGDRGAGNGINNLGISTGFLGLNGGSGADAPRGVLWARGRTYEIETDAFFLFPRDINLWGTVVGTAEITEFEPVPFVWEP